jgi:hypothetical protein
MEVKAETTPLVKQDRDATSGALLFVGGLIVGAVVGILIGLLIAVLIYGSQGRTITPTPLPNPEIPVAPAEPGVDQPAPAPTTPTTPEPSAEVKVLVPDRVKLESPKLGDKLSGKLSLKGEMKGFFEGTLSFKLVGENGNKLYSNVVTATDDNYVGFAPFSGEFTLPRIASQPAKLILYEVSAKDGSEKNILELSVQF